MTAAAEETPKPGHQASTIMASPDDVSALASPEMDGASFEALMKERTRIRKEREEYSVAELRVRISKLEQALTAEVKRRVQATDSLQEACQQQVAIMEARLQQQLEQQSQTIQSRLDHLESRLSELETKSEKQALEQTKLVEKKGLEFRKTVEDLKTEMEGEKKSRLVREGRFLQQLESHSAALEKKWSTERQERVTSIAELTQDLSLKEQARLEQQTTWQSRIDKELADLTKELQEEIVEREAQDENTIAALHQFTQQLQSSLAILSGE